MDYDLNRGRRKILSQPLSGIAAHGIRRLVSMNGNAPGALYTEFSGLYVVFAHKVIRIYERSSLFLSVLGQYSKQI
jgi:hypothetical protein